MEGGVEEKKEGIEREDVGAKSAKSETRPAAQQAASVAAATTSAATQGEATAKRKKVPRPAPKPGQGVQPGQKPAIYVNVERDPEIQAARLQLPIIGEEQVCACVRAYTVPLGKEKEGSRDGGNTCVRARVYTVRLRKENEGSRVNWYCAC